MPTFSNPTLGAPGSVTAIGVTHDSKQAWWGTSEYVIEVRYLNTFSNDPVPARDVHRLVRTPTGRTRTATGLGDAGYTECEVTDQDFVRSAFMISQAYEMWQIDKTLEAYYNFVTGYDLGVPATAAGLGAAPTAWAGAGLTGMGLGMSWGGSSVLGPTLAYGGAAMSSGAIGMGLAAYGYSIFYLATAAVQANLPAGTLISTGWAFVGIGFSAEVPGVPVTHWIRC